MRYALVLAALSLSACGSASRSGECEEICPDDATQAAACVTTIEACEVGTGDAATTCIDAAVVAYEALCEATDTDEEETDVAE